MKQLAAILFLCRFYPSNKTQYAEIDELLHFENTALSQVFCIGEAGNTDLKTEGRRITPVAVGMQVG